MASPVLSLTTDFGLADHYAGVMKGVVLGICSGAQIVDISHEITPFAIGQGAFLIAQSYRCFPPGAVHLVVVDPGVGSDRRAMVLEAAGQYFVGPDNGVFSLVMSREKYTARAIANSRYFRHPVSQTFHGRDIFAPVAAHIAAGVPAADIGDVIEDPVLLDLTQPQVLHIDRFGNVITNLVAADFKTEKPRLEINGARIEAFATHYAAFEPGPLFVIEGSSGFLEVSLNRGSAAEKIGCRAGDAVRFAP